jgi:peroxiredoxin
MKKIALLSFSLLVVAFSMAQDRPEGLFINSKAPEIRGTDQGGKEVSLKDLRKKGSVVVLFYRGYWCPYCNHFLQKLQDSLQMITDKGASVIAVTPESTEGISKTVEKTKASFPVVYDEDMKFAKAYHVAFRVDDIAVQRSKNAGIDLLANNHQKEPWLPVPAVYIVNKEGSVTYRYFNEDYKKRPSVREILAALDKTF